MSDHEHVVAVPEITEIGRLRQWLGGKTATQIGGLLVIFIIWEILFRAQITSELLFPSMLDVIAQFWLNGPELFKRVGVTFTYIGYAMGISLVLSFFLTYLSMKSEAVASVMEMILAMMHPLPSVALLPLLIIWFGLGELSLLIVE